MSLARLLTELYTQTGTGIRLRMEDQLDSHTLPIRLATRFLINHYAAQVHDLSQACAIRGWKKRCVWRNCSNTDRSSVGLHLHLRRNWLPVRLHIRKCCRVLNKHTWPRQKRCAKKSKMNSILKIWQIG